MSLHFIADLHLGHENAVKWRTQFSCAEEMNQLIIDNWNNQVNKQDTVFILGDVAWNYKSLDLLSGMRGKKKLILGNHDEMKMEAYMKYFTHIYGAYEWKHKIMLTHIPVHDMNMDRFRLNIHGHLHDDLVLNPDLDSMRDDDPRYINVSCEQINYTPISWDELNECEAIC